MNNGASRRNVKRILNTRFTMTPLSSETFAKNLKHDPCSLSAEFCVGRIHNMEPRLDPRQNDRRPDR